MFPYEGDFIQDHFYNFFLPGIDQIPRVPPHPTRKHVNNKIKKVKGSTSVGINKAPINAWPSADSKDRA